MLAFYYGYNVNNLFQTNGQLEVFTSNVLQSSSWLG